MLDNFGKKGFIGNPNRAAIHHMLTDEISYFQEPHDSGCYEIAFFYRGEWVTDYIPEFAEYADGKEEDFTLVYRYVPKDLVEKFVEDHL